MQGYLLAKSNLIAYAKFKHSIITILLQIGPLFGVLHKEEKPGDFSLPKIGKQTFLLLVFPSRFRKRFPSLKKLVIVDEILVSKWRFLYFYLKPFRS